eukprot:s1398_g26.t1
MTRSAKKPRLWFAILTLLTFVGWAPTDFVKHGTTHRRGSVRLAAAGETWWCQRGGINGKLKDCFEEKVQTDGVPLLKHNDTYQASLPVRELGISQPLKLHQLQFFVREPDLDAFAARLAADERPTVAYITAASHSGKSASVVVGVLRFRELDSGDDARLNFTHYLYMPSANNCGNYHRRVGEDVVQSACGKSTKLREALGATYMRECFRQAIAGAYVKNWQSLTDLSTLDFEDTKKLLEEDASTFKQRNPIGVLLVHIDEHRSMCRDPDFRRGAMRVLAELPGVQVVATYSDIPPLPKQKRKMLEESGAVDAGKAKRPRVCVNCTWWASSAFKRCVKGFCAVSRGSPQVTFRAILNDGLKPGAKTKKKTKKVGKGLGLEKALDWLYRIHAKLKPETVESLFTLGLDGGRPAFPNLP